MPTCVLWGLTPSQNCNVPLWTRKCICNQCKWMNISQTTAIIILKPPREWCCYWRQYQCVCIYIYILLCMFICLYEWIEIIAQRIINKLQKLIDSNINININIIINKIDANHCQYAVRVCQCEYIYKHYIISHQWHYDDDHHHHLSPQAATDRLTNYSNILFHMYTCQASSAVIWCTCLTAYVM